MMFYSFVVVYNVFRKPTIALHYNSKKLKRLPDQRWTGHLATVTAVFNFFQHVTLLLQEMGTLRAHKAETRIETSGLLREVQKNSILFKILSRYALLCNHSYCLSCK